MKPKRGKGPEASVRCSLEDVSRDNGLSSGVHRRMAPRPLGRVTRPRKAYSLAEVGGGGADSSNDKGFKKRIVVREEKKLKDRKNEQAEGRSSRKRRWWNPSGVVRLGGTVGHGACLERKKRPLDQRGGHRQKKKAGCDITSRKVLGGGSRPKWTP